MSVPIDETSPLLLPVFRRRLGGLGGFKKLFQVISHRQNISDSDGRRHGDFTEMLTGSPPFYNGKLSCFFAGISTFLSLSIASDRAIRFRVECGIMTSSM
jgi:hypothetical protein